MAQMRTNFKGLKRWDEGRWGIGNEPQYSRLYTKGLLTHLPPSYLLSPLEFRVKGFLKLLNIRATKGPLGGGHRDPSNTLA